MTSAREAAFDFVEVRGVREAGDGVGMAGGWAAAGGVCSVAAGTFDAWVEGWMAGDEVCVGGASWAVNAGRLERQQRNRTAAACRVIAKDCSVCRKVSSQIMLNRLRALPEDAAAQVN